jgi:L-rhamnose isomerase/sugar isomerase
VKDSKAALRDLSIELPSWAFGNSGTRFKVFAQPGVPRTPFEKADDAAQVHKYTGVAPSLAVHIPWDRVDDYEALAVHAKNNGIRIGTVNANVFQDDDYKLGSVCNPDPRIRRKALDHLLECVDIMDATGSRDLKLWFADGINYPGQDDIGARQDRLAESLRVVYERLGDHQRMLWSTSSSSPRSTPPTCRTGERACCTARRWGRRRRSSWTRATTRRG